MIKKITRGWWTVRFESRKKRLRMFACPWAYIIIGKFNVEVGTF